MSATPLRILIVDDEQPARARLRELLGDCAAEVPHLIAGEAANGFEALDCMAATIEAAPPAPLSGQGPNLVPNLILADIHMPGMTGIELARHVQLLESPPAVVFITAHDQYAVAAFELNAVDYLLKPVRAARLAAALKKAAAGGRPAPEVLARLDHQPRRHFSIAERGRVKLVPVGEVLFMKAGQKYVALVTREHEHLVEDSLASLEQEFDSLFIRIHRSTLVARRSIRGFERVPAQHGDEEGEGWAVVLEGWPDKLPVSRRQWPAVRSLLKA